MHKQKADTMDNHHDILRIISNETKNSIEKIGIVTPSVYSSIFADIISKYNLDLTDEKNVAKEVIDAQCTNLATLQTKTEENAIKLSKNTTEAIDAIKDKNEIKLNEVLNETEKLRKEIEKLKQSVYKDELTNVYNRKWLHDIYLKDNSNNFKKNGTIVLIDLNYFKLINDSLGHVIGDKVLIFIAQHFQKISNNIVRYGGDEFIIIFDENISERRVKELIYDKREKIISKKLKVQEKIFRVSFSIGIATFKENDDLGEIIEIADKKMYSNKLEIKKRIKGID